MKKSNAFDYNFSVGLLPSKKICFNCTRSKMFEKYSLFHLKSSFRSPDI